MYNLERVNVHIHQADGRAGLLRRKCGWLRQGTTNVSQDANRLPCVLHRRKSFVLWLSVVLFGVFLCPWTATWGQGSSTASVTGTVLDSTGAAVANAQVVITQTDTGFSLSATSDGEGRFAFAVLPVGSYQLEVTKEGFNKYQQVGIVLTVSQAAQFSVSLNVGAVQQTIHVNATATLVNTTTGVLSQLVDQEQVVDLPLNGRNPAGLVLLSAGVSNPAMNTSSGSGVGTALQFAYPAGIGGSIEQQGALIPTINGIRSGGVYFALDGANNVDPYTVSGGPFPNPDAVEEFRVLTNGYGAQYFSAPGGAVNIVTRSGTNDFHGDLFVFVRNGVLDSRNYFAPTRDNLVRNQFGATAGGPIRKDKFLIFGSYQGTTLSQGVGGITEFVLTDAQRAGDFSAVPRQLHNPYTGAPFPNNQIPMSDFNPVASQILAHLPHSTAPDGRVELVLPVSESEQQGVVKADYLMGKQRFVVRYFATGQVYAGNVNAQDWLTVAGPTSSLWQEAMIGHDYVGDRIVNQARLTYQRDGYENGHSITTGYKQLGSNITEPASPYIWFIPVQGYFNVNASAPVAGSHDVFPRNTISASEQLSIVRGRHQISVGGGWEHINDSDRNDTLESGFPVFANLPPFPPVQPFLSFTSGNVLSDFVLGKPTVFAQRDGMQARLRGNLLGFYGEDQIRATARLSLTLGLRWDPYWPFHTLHGRALCFRPGEQSTVFTNAPMGLVVPGDPGCDGSGGVSTDLKTFQPRIGFAYGLDQKGNTSIRGGYGIYVMQLPMQTFLPFGWSAPYTRFVVHMFPTSISNPWGNNPGGDPFTGGFRAGDESLPSDTPFPSNLSVTVMNPNWKVANVQQWNFTLEHRLPGNTVVRASYVGTKGTHLSLNRDENAPVYIPGQCNGAPCSTISNEQARRPYPTFQGVLGNESRGSSSYNALQLTAERRFGAGLFFSSNFTWSKSIDIVSSNANGLETGAFSQVPDPFNVKAYRGLSDFDVPYSFVISAVWQLPSFKSDSFIPKYVLSHWQASGIWTWQAGEPFTVFSGVDNSLTGVGLDLADRVPGVSPYLSPDRPRSEVIQEYFNVNAFQPNAIGTFGNSQRNSLFGPGYMNIDFAVMKIIPFKERYRLTIRGEFFNLTNTPHFEFPISSPIGTPGFGEITAARDPRIIQLAAKFNW
jgi:hypothetical protein